ncbi:RNase H domain-containing protein [Trichonephila inaurata madagascariensis]|uniref:RNase H domain-containing protein n=1 Tax=Trichonephila inaurata madagascariensis TaxID=2747483 RepID=A0A8X6MK44_9ARAC|nr:RNase H domain-containing protein [Trichonephila inaurata madagascariensis]
MPTNSSVDRLIKRSRCLIKRAKEHVKTKEHLKGYDSRCAIQHLQDWTRVVDLVSIRIINKLRTIAKYRDVHFQWIPSHVNVPENEVTDFLAKRASEIATTNYALTYREIYSSKKIKDKQVWMAPLDHPGISRKSPGGRGALEFDGDRNDQTAVSRLLSEHLKCMIESGRKVLQTCPKCHLLPVSLEHIPDCLGFALEDVHASPLLVLDFARVNGLVDLIQQPLDPEVLDTHTL